jgi:hypothetical protein
MQFWRNRFYPGIDQYTDLPHHLREVLDHIIDRRNDAIGARRQLPKLAVEKPQHKVQGSPVLCLHTLGVFAAVAQGEMDCPISRTGEPLDRRCMGLYANASCLESRYGVLGPDGPRHSVRQLIERPRLSRLAWRSGVR